MRLHFLPLHTYVHTRVHSRLANPKLPVYVQSKSFVTEQNKQIEVSVAWGHILTQKKLAAERMRKTGLILLFILYWGTREREREREKLGRTEEDLSRESMQFPLLTCLLTHSRASTCGLARTYVYVSNTPPWKRMHNNVYTYTVCMNIHTYMYVNALSQWTVKDIAAWAAAPAGVQWANKPYRWTREAF